jgi:hypothetical protein
MKPYGRVVVNFRVKKESEGHHWQNEGRLSTWQGETPER